MSLRINNNPTAVNAHRNLTQNSEVSAKNLERLSSGLKVNRGADGPAALQVSEHLRAQTAGLDQAIENSWSTLRTKRSTTPSCCKRTSRK